MEASKPITQKHAMDTAVRTPIDYARPSVSTPEPNVPYHVRYISRRIHGVYYSTYYTGCLGALVLVFKGHKHA